MKSQNSKDREMHPQFPSGEWEGFYTYETNTMGAKTPMNFQLDFSNGGVTGSGGDSVGGFSWTGTYSTSEMRSKMTKSYVTHEVFYDGHVDENGIWGTWFIPPTMRGGFHIWPKKGAEQAVAVEKAVKKKAAKKKKKNKLVKTL